MAKQFSWEQEYKRTWEEGPQSKINEAIMEADASYSNNRKGIIRHLHIVVDVSEAIDKIDFLPSFRANIVKALEEFVPSFYTENPLSVLSFLSVRDVCVKYVSSVDIDIHSFLGQTGCKWFSLLNGLEGSVEIMKNSTYVKEILVIVASTSTRDPHGYTEVLSKMKAYSIKVHFISLCGEVALYKSISKATEGGFYVPIDMNHFSAIMARFHHPSDYNGTKLSLAKIGFPLILEEPSVCACHLEMKMFGYECPVCNTIVCSLPIHCPICSTQLVSTLSLSKSLRFLYPLKPFVCASNGMCSICGIECEWMCEGCRNTFCRECNSFIHGTLSFCVYCDDPYN
ncbi:RNA polymerase II transcription factor [Ordospora colligata]|uniref:RNA polymerase II transcription factor n=1 Tax=Ordospora colligata OC4 TaxID=1354746 RepID=A0A0B2ULG7_9MICR|nr:RNA polymerase II transcription factor [Ordospora colligata OC4]KHN69877.1 RNA polymerase II transcription factor [Ordospora colligata OC4]TBU16047.1 RNA polymerase II transcription factor [Ordospora colligata]TBU16260.1 RNA polymerase II transcription factor [Ordospora colligata]TBU18964.1 RNA polymerase II transcription factor [Ordospora colligata]